MNRPATILTWLGLVATAPTLVAQAQTSSGDAARGVTIARAGSQPSAKGSAQSFTGSVRVDPLFAAVEPSRVSGGHVTFEPGARSAWHTHPKGQRLVVLSGVGLTQAWGQPINEIRAGDVVWCPPGVKHWHGASAPTGMTHIAIQEAVEGKNVDWMEQVSDEQYRR